MLKRCTSCGVDKPIEEFRTYYNRQKGHYPYCKECERIEGRRKYLSRNKEKLNEDQLVELNKIETLYDKRQAAGLSVPSRKRNNNTSVAKLVDAYLAQQE